MSFCIRKQFLMLYQIINFSKERTLKKSSHESIYILNAKNEVKRSRATTFPIAKL